VTDQTRPFPPQHGVNSGLTVLEQHSRTAGDFLRAGILLTALLLTAPNAAAQIRPFTTDGCSEFPDGTPRHRQIWRDCCVAHDRAYWRGGTREERLQADLDLEACVDEVGEPAIARLMLAGVRVGGSPWVANALSLGLRLALATRIRALDPGRA
jgi:hypothetical protein